MSDKQWWEPLIEDDGKLDWLCDHEGDYSEKINELWTQFIALRLNLSVTMEELGEMRDRAEKAEAKIDAVITATGEEQ
jgi:uncharacterized coiled-coil DUF342 family protein